MKYHLRYLVLLSLVFAACLPVVPPKAEVSVAITVVDEADIGTAVGAALTSTAQSGVARTETALAVAGISPTPSLFPTETDTPLPPTATPYLSPTPSDTPTSTQTPSNTPVPSNTPRAETLDTPGQIRVVHAWRSPSSTPLDIFINQLPVALGLDLGATTAFHAVGSDETVRLLALAPSGRLPDAGEAGASATGGVPAVDQLIDVPPGSSVTVILWATSLDQGVRVKVVYEDISPLPSGKSRISFVHANPDLLSLNLSEASRGLSLVSDLSSGESVGPFDIDSGSVNIAAFDAETPDRQLFTLPGFFVDSNVNYLMVLIPGADFNTNFLDTETILVQSSTQITRSDVPVRFVNASPNTGSLRIELDGDVLLQNLAVSEISPVLPVSGQSANLQVFDTDGNPVFSDILPTWNTNDRSEHIIMLADLPPDAADGALTGEQGLASYMFDRLPRSLSAFASLRLLNGLTGATQTMDLELRVTDPNQIENPIGVPSALESNLAWSRVIHDVGFGVASDYVRRASNVFDLRVVLSTTGGVQATLERQPLLPGGSYDVFILPGSGVGSIRLRVLEPDPQISLLGLRQGDAEVVNAIVEATLTALAPQAETGTVEAPRTPTPTISPVPTNTPRPTNTLQAAEAYMELVPAPPNAARSNLVIIGHSFPPLVQFTLNIDTDPSLLTGQVDEGGEFSLVLQLPAGIEPGPHVLRVCADCGRGGKQLESLANFVAADPNVVPSATPTP